MVSFQIVINVYFAKVANRYVCAKNMEYNFSCLITYFFDSERDSPMLGLCIGVFLR